MHVQKATSMTQVGNWLPSHEAIEAWLGKLSAKVEGKRGRVKYHPPVQELADLIDTDPVVRMYFTQMIEQVPQTKAYRQNHLKSIPQMLRLINEVMTMGPEYNDTELVGCPLNAVFDWCMGTPAGFAAFRMDNVNAVLTNILNYWCKFLSGPGSLYVLNDSPTGWKSLAAQKGLNMPQYVYKPRDTYWGFKSWNDFFTRPFKPGQRPVADPDDNKVIVSACESTPYNIEQGVARQAQFWIKAQPYSLQDMLANDESVEQFVGGTVYQAFLSALNYHRWHAPVSGTITKAFVQPGTYYSEADSEGEDPGGPNNSQGYITQVAARALIFIQADEPSIGLMCVILVGMAEISSCVIQPQIKPGYKVKKGEELGYFQYGGSTHCLVFRPGAIAEFTLNALPQPNNPNAPLVLLSTKIAVAT
jgi:phosphatidylserine decarboxylase